MVEVSGGAMQRADVDVIVLSAPRGTIVLPEGADGALAARLRQALVGTHPLGAVVDALTASGVESLPSFCAVFPTDDQCRVLVRGDGVASVTVGDGAVTHVVARAGMTTWREEHFEGVASVSLQSNTSAAPVIEVLLGEALAVGPPKAPPAPSPRAAKPAPPPPPVVDEPRTPADLTLAVAHEPVSFDEEPPVLADDAAAPPRASDEPDFDFSHLLEHTHYRGAEAAAVRSPEDAAAEPQPVAADLSQLPPPSAPQPLPPPPAPPSGGGGGLIDGIPGAPSPGPAPPPPPAPAAPTTAPPAPADGDHDGHTIAASQLRGILGAQPPTATSPVGVGVQAVFCVAGHPNPPHAGQCRSCGGNIADRTVRPIGRPSLGRLRFSTGAVVELDRPQLVGRRPTVDPNQPVSELPGLITVPDPEQALSRVHAEVRLEGWDVFVVDRGSKNGTFVEIPGHAPTKLRAGEPCLIVAGTRVSLADVSTFEFDVGGP